MEQDHIGAEPQKIPDWLSHHRRLPKVSGSAWSTSQWNASAFSCDIRLSKPVSEMRPKFRLSNISLTAEDSAVPVPGERYRDRMKPTRLNIDFAHPVVIATIRQVLPPATNFRKISNDQGRQPSRPRGIPRLFQTLLRTVMDSLPSSMLAIEVPGRMLSSRVLPSVRPGASGFHHGYSSNTAATQGRNPSGNGKCSQHVEFFAESGNSVADAGSDSTNYAATTVLQKTELRHMELIPQRWGGQIDEQTRNWPTCANTWISFTYLKS